MALVIPDSVRTQWKAVLRAEARQQKRLAALGIDGGWASPGGPPDGDIEALAILVLLKSSELAREDLKAIMAGVKAITRERAKLRAALVAAVEAAVGGGRGTDIDADAFAAALASLQLSAQIDQVRKEVDDLTELDELYQLQLQMILERKAEMQRILSNVGKNAADLLSYLAGNLKA